MSTLVGFGSNLLGFGAGEAATGAQVVLFPTENIGFRSKGDFVLSALAGYMKRESDARMNSYGPVVDLTRRTRGGWQVHARIAA